MIKLYPSFFNDVFGPVMLGGSSSHLAGPQRLGLAINALTEGKKITKIEVIMDSEGSFAGTFGIMSEDIGMLSGGLGMPVDDLRRNDCHHIAKEQGIEVKFTKGVMKESDHLNSMKFEITTSDGKVHSIVGDSIGGGMIQTKKIMGFDYIYNGESNLLILVKETHDANFIDTAKAHLDGVLECSTSSNESGTAYFFKAEIIPPIEEIKKNYPDCQVYFIPYLLPTPFTVRVKPQLFKTGTEWVKLCKETKKSMHEVAIDYQIAATGMSRDEIIERMRYLSGLMIRQVECMAQDDFGDYYHCYGFSTDLYNRLTNWQKENSHLPEVVRNAVKHYFSVLSMAPGVLNVPGPHGAGGGVVMSSLRAAQLEYGFSEDKLIEGLLVAAGYGIIAYDRTEPTGEVIGCAGEQGLALVFATAALTHILGGSPEAVESAAAQAMQVSIGWPCDPATGAEGEPCLARGMIAVTTPFVFAELAKAGIISPFPFHEMLDVVVDVSKNYGPELLCTGRGGCAACPTAIKLKKQIGL
ncbi:hypothetical protein SH2C18_27350 [Clostridium sediminicola]|uniref:L-serine ammonia-lyase, iron-sulfur-dependent, subunit alpha n=1 Tax=Clostridium sediminicola TaxID=3114879 RepID=UPI0031F1EECC